MSSRRWSGVPLVAASTLVLLLAGLAATLSTGVTGAPPRAAPSAPAPPASPAAPALIEPSPTQPAVKRPLDVPSYAPAAAGSVRSVQGQFAGPCTVGSVCSLQVAVAFRPGSGPTAVAWKLEIFDRCSGDSVERTGQRFVAPAGWNHILITSPIQLPVENGAAIVIVTTAPGVAASQPLTPSPPSC